MSVPRRSYNEEPDVIYDYAPPPQFAGKQPDNPEDLNKPISDVNRHDEIYAPDNTTNRYSFRPPIDVYSNLVPGGNDTPPAPPGGPDEPTPGPPSGPPGGPTDGPTVDPVPTDATPTNDISFIQFDETNKQISIPLEEAMVAAKAVLLLLSSNNPSLLTDGETKDELRTSGIYTGKMLLDVSLSDGGSGLILYKALNYNIGLSPEFQAFVKSDPAIYNACKQYVNTRGGTEFERTDELVTYVGGLIAGVYTHAPIVCSMILTYMDGKSSAPNTYFPIPSKQLVTEETTNRWRKYRLGVKAKLYEQVEKYAATFRGGSPPVEVDPPPGPPTPGPGPPGPGPPTPGPTKDPPVDLPKTPDRPKPDPPAGSDPFADLGKGILDVLNEIRNGIAKVVPGMGGGGGKSPLPGTPGGAPAGTPGTLPAGTTGIINTNTTPAAINTFQVGQASSQVSELAAAGLNGISDGSLNLKSAIELDPQKMLDSIMLQKKLFSQVIDSTARVPVERLESEDTNDRAVLLRKANELVRKYGREIGVFTLSYNMSHPVALLKEQYNYLLKKSNEWLKLIAGTQTADAAQLSALHDNYTKAQQVIDDTNRLNSLMQLKGVGLSQAQQENNQLQGAALQSAGQYALGGNRDLGLAMASALPPLPFFQVGRFLTGEKRKLEKMEEEEIYIANTILPGYNDMILKVTKLPRQDAIPFNDYESFKYV